MAGSFRLVARLIGGTIYLTQVNQLDGVLLGAPYVPTYEIRRVSDQTVLASGTMTAGSVDGEWVATVASPAEAAVNMHAHTTFTYFGLTVLDESVIEDFTLGEVISDLDLVEDTLEVELVDDTLDVSLVDDVLEVDLVEDTLTSELVDDTLDITVTCEAP